MTVSIGSVVLSNNLHLLGIETNADVSYSYRETLGGSAVLQIEPRMAGALLTLVARHDGSSRMGTFCSKDIVTLKAMAATTGTYSLVHPAGTFNVKILSFNLEQSDEREPPGDYKKWHGEIVLQEVTT